MRTAGPTRGAFDEVARPVFVRSADLEIGDTAGWSRGCGMRYARRRCVQGAGPVAPLPIGIRPEILPALRKMILRVGQVAVKSES